MSTKYNVTPETTSRVYKPEMQKICWPLETSENNEK